MNPPATGKTGGNRQIAALSQMGQSRNCPLVHYSGFDDRPVRDPDDVANALYRAVMHDNAIAVAAGMSLGVARGSARRSMPWAIGMAIAAPLALLLCVWWFRAFRSDPSLLYFLANVTELPSSVLFSTGAAVAVGAWFGGGRNRRR